MSIIRFWVKPVKDLTRLGAGELTCIMLILIINTVASVLSIRITASLFEMSASFGDSASADIYTLGVLFCLCVALPRLLECLNKILRDINLHIKYSFDARKKLYEHNSRLPLECIEDTQTHDNLYRAQVCVNNFHLLNLFIKIFELLPAAFGIIGTAAVLAEYQAWFVPLAVLSVAPALVLNYIKQTQQYRLWRGQVKGARRRDYLYSLFADNTAIKEMRSMGFGRYIISEWINENSKIQEEQYTFILKVRFRLFLCEFFQILCYAACILAASWLFIQGEIQIGIFGACITAFLNMQNSANTVGTNIASLPENVFYMADYYKHLNTEKEPPGTEDYIRYKECIRAEDLCFCYPQRDKNAVDAVNLVIPNGQRVVIVGENGSGKTTLAKLLCGVYKPQSGRIYYDEQDLSITNKKSFWKHFSIVPQDFMRYSLSLRQNIALSDISGLHDDSRLIKAVKAANLEDMLLNEDGLDIRMGREFGGIDLSGGGWQKTAIARGLFKNSDVISLDEPTSALDPLMESEILLRFLEMIKGKTAIIISHRVGLCRHVDRVIVMKKGRIVEDGTHEELIAAAGEYARIWNEQAKWYE